MSVALVSLFPLEATGGGELYTVETAQAIAASGDQVVLAAPVRGWVETKSSEYLKPTALKSAATLGHGSPDPVYGFDPPAMPIQTSCDGSASTLENVEMSASGKTYVASAPRV